MRRVLGPRRRTGPGSRDAAGAVPPVPQAAIGAAAPFLELRPWACDLPQARHRDGFAAPRRNARELGDAVFLPARAATDQRRRVTGAASSRPPHTRRHAAI